jgi:hypothetical protein
VMVQAGKQLTVDLGQGNASKATVSTR